MHRNNVLVLDPGEDVDFRLNHAFFAFALGLVDDFHGVCSAIAAVGDLLDLGECSAGGRGVV